MHYNNLHTIVIDQPTEQSKNKCIINEAARINLSASITCIGIPSTVGSALFYAATFSPCSAVTAVFSTMLCLTGVGCLVSEHCIIEE